MTTFHLSYKAFGTYACIWAYVGLQFFFPFGATAPIWALAYLRETLRFTSVY
jgi:hypothetical protein